MQDRRGALVGALRRPRYEVIPLPGIEDGVVEHVPKHIKITVTASPRKGLEPTLDLAGRLSAEGFAVAPHLSARLIRDGAELGEILARLREVGVRDVFVVAGDAPEPAGEFEGSGALLRAMDEIGHGLDEVGITGYPESHPLISDEVTIQAMFQKEPHATYIASQICFDTRIINEWVLRVRRRGVGLPIYVGMPGAVSMTKLVRISSKIGLGESARFLQKYGNWFWRMFMPGGYSPDALVEGVSLDHPELKVRGFHVYTFNEVEQTEAWRRGALERFGATPREERHEESTV
ncbi:5,10-methylenetetrahydrofolate reductase [Rubrobacter tropicus]|uniref:Methylenetetrahydrofolate reductase n=1 Tax=Rubrobacter tropicus TaxID=2653851 RepID=A0A6G8Q5U8_9ACTN|nr:methylenetetrahydrofolate reductase [Rubrobacter tropicus]QIN81864.1 5,10-methylenetetrahydrofolate reductase [Rubrobacter tropicus]